jgi:hypothetical protein
MQRSSPEGYLRRACSPLKRGEIGPYTSSTSNIGARAISCIIYLLEGVVDSVTRNRQHVFLGMPVSKGAEQRTVVGSTARARRTSPAPSRSGGSICLPCPWRTPCSRPTALAWAAGSPVVVAQREWRVGGRSSRMLLRDLPWPARAGAGSLTARLQDGCEPRALSKASLMPLCCGPWQRLVVGGVEGRCKGTERCALDINRFAMIGGRRYSSNTTKYSGIWYER